MTTKNEIALAKNRVPAPVFGAGDHVVVVLGFLSNPDETLSFVQKTHTGTDFEIYRWESSPETSKFWDALVESADKIKVSEKHPGWSKFGKFLAKAAAKALSGTGKKAEEWARAKRNADREVEKLVEKILALPRERRENLVLVGHSLGGRMVVKTLAKLAEKNAKIKRAILMAAAIDVRAPEIKTAADATLAGIENRYNPDDVVLGKIYETVGELIERGLERSLDKTKSMKTTALGTQKVDFVPANWTNLRVGEQGAMNHFFEYYWG